ncbi:hypothetical protein LSG31_00700 [Fodinisporobacter ferrooxydans]|uniref:DUF3284 domain-containing protein n=1 Tax=Fodinisporobacter ferrooxydans TaxID=2901836 RepID=A0ABY4CJZ2_9BACL|nr:hypothetical protein LSG31_00700 [Alicyclobacillaceae bacterium MYW30-H2]
MAFDKLTESVNNRKFFLKVQKEVLDTAKSYIAGAREELTPYLNNAKLQCAFNSDSMSLSIIDPSKTIYQNDLTYSFKIRFSNSENQWKLIVSHYGLRNVFKTDLGQVPHTYVGLSQKQVSDFYVNIGNNLLEFILKTFKDIETT